MVYAKKKRFKTKVCTNCRIRKPIEKFCQNKKASDGFHWWCKDCASNQAKKYNDARRVKFLPYFVCPKCGKKVRLNFYPKYELKKWKKFKCSNCKFSPYANK